MCDETEKGQLLTTSDRLLDISICLDLVEPILLMNLDFPAKFRHHRLGIPPVNQDNFGCWCPEPDLQPIPARLSTI